MITYKKCWKDQDRQMHELSALRAKNLAEEIVVGWTDQTDLSGFDLELATHATEFYADMIRDGCAESHSDEVVQDLLAMYCDNIAYEGGKVVDGEGLHDFHTLCWAETMLAARALKAFSDYLRGRLAEMPPEQVEAA
jgi:hypothetical protein